MTEDNPSGMRGSRVPGFGVLLRICAIGLVAAAFPGLAAAQGMRDPTRPPAQFLNPADSAQDAMPSESGLQTIKRTGKRYVALLNGEWVRPGDKAGEAVVVKIEEHAVKLQYPDGRRETIGMYPDVELRPRKVARAAGR